MDHSVCTRARVALTPTSPMIHVGHARTLLLGSLIAKEVGVPFHVRMDPAVVGCPADMLIAVDECCRFLRIAVDKYIILSVENIYEHPLAEILYSMSPGLAAPICDDFIAHAPSLMIRGSEFANPMRWFAPENRASSQAQITVSRAAARLLGQEWHEIIVPLVLRGSEKMAKSSMSIPWDVLKMVSSFVVRDFLMATAVCPEAPLGVMGYGCPLEKMTTKPYVWSWDTWRLLEHDYQ